MPEDVTPNDTPTNVTPGDGGAGDGTPAGGDDAANTPGRPGIREIFAAEEAKAKASAETPADDGGDDSGDGDADKEPAGDKPADTPATADADADKTPDADEDADADKDKPADDPAATAAAAAAAEADAAKQELDDLLATYDDPEVLNAALKKAGVTKVSELPAVKEIIGRVSQSVRDQTLAEAARSAREAAQIADATREGKAAKSKLTAALKAASEALESDDPEAVIELPTDEAVEKAFEDYADSAVGEYHTRAWNALSETIYSLPEFGGDMPDDYAGPPVPALNDQQKALLASVKGESAQAWLAAHLMVQRDVLWDWAQAHSNADLVTQHETEKVQLQAAHKNEITKLTRAHEKALNDAREEARAEALADVSAGRVTPKTPGKTPSTTERDPNENKPKRGAGIREVHAWAAEQEKSKQQGASV